MEKFLKKKIKFLQWTFVLESSNLLRKDSPSGDRRVRPVGVPWPGSTRDHPTDTKVLESKQTQIN